MAIWVSNDTRLVVQGITGHEGTFHTLRDRAYGTNVVAGVTPGKAGQDVEGIPVYDTVADAVREQGADTAMIFVPPRFAAEAILEAADAGVPLVFGEGWIGYTPLHGTFEEGPVGAAFCRAAAAEAARVGAWGSVVCSNAAPHHPMWQDITLQRECNALITQAG